MRKPKNHIAILLLLLSFIMIGADISYHHEQSHRHTHATSSNVPEINHMYGCEDYFYTSDNASLNHTFSEISLTFGYSHIYINNSSSNIWQPPKI